MKPPMHLGSTFSVFAYRSPQLTFLSLWQESTHFSQRERNGMFSLVLLSFWNPWTILRNKRWGGIKPRLLVLASWWCSSKYHILSRYCSSHWVFPLSYHLSCPQVIEHLDMGWNPNFKYSPFCLLWWKSSQSWGVVGFLFDRGYSWAIPQKVSE